MSLRMQSLVLTLALLAGLSASTAFALSSYPTMVTDEVGVTGAPAAATGVPDYQFVNDLGLGFGGTNADVFDVGESAVLFFPFPLRNIPLQHDVIVYAFVGGLGATDNATVQVEVSSDGMTYEIVGTFDTEEARNREQDALENEFEAVKQFFVEFGSANRVSHIRLTNLAGTSEGLRLDAVEGLHPDVVSAHGFEIRIERIREDFAKQFMLRIKNIGDPGGVPIREVRVNNSATPGTRLEETVRIFASVDGDFICVENCVPNNGPLIPFSRHVWSVDGLTEAPPGQGLDPGRQAAHFRWFGLDTDSDDPYLSGYSFEVTFADGLVHAFDYDADVTKQIGSLYQQYQYFAPMPEQTWNRPVDFYEFASDDPTEVPGLSGPAVWLLLLLGVGGGGWLIRREDGQGEGA